VTELVELYLTRYIEDRYVVDEKSPEKKVKINGARKPKGQRECRRTLYGDAVKILGDYAAAKVTRKDIVRMVDTIIQRGANVQAGNVLRELNSAYEYAIGMEYFPDNFSNPALQAKEALKRTKVKLSANRGDRFLTDQELVKFYNWLPGSGYSNNHKNIMRLTLWTGMRTGVVCEAEWSEIDLDKATWFVPKEKSKTRTNQWVQLPTQAVEFLRQLKLNTNEYLFPSSRTGLPIQQKSLSEMKWHLRNPERLQNGRKFQKRQLWLDTIPDWSPHDLRRTVRTGLSRIQCPSEVAEAAIGHGKKGIEGTYNLHEYEAECRIWLQRWADHMDGLSGN
jgi:integrase